MDFLYYLYNKVDFIEFRLEWTLTCNKHNKKEEKKNILDLIFFPRINIIMCIIYYAHILYATSMFQGLKGGFLPFILFFPPWIMWLM